MSKYVCFCEFKPQSVQLGKYKKIKKIILDTVDKIPEEYQKFLINIIFRWEKKTKETIVVSIAIIPWSFSYSEQSLISLQAFFGSTPDTISSIISGA